MRLFCLSVQDVANDLVWEDVSPLLKQFAAKTGETSPEQVRRGALDSVLQIWGLQDAEKVQAVLVTEVIMRAADHVCVIRIACGDVPAPMQERLLDEVGKWAKELGCTRVRFVGRHGWLRRYPRFRQSAVVGEWSLTP